jgi:invasion protein IalB
MLTSKSISTALGVLLATTIGAAAQPAKPAQIPAGTAKSVPAEKATPAEKAPAQAPVPTRTEIQSFDNWRLTCNDYADTKKRVCFGQLQAFKRETKQLVFGWTIAQTLDGTVESTVTTLTGVAITRGIDFKVGAAALRKLSFATCEPTHCTAPVTVDAALRKDLVTAETVEVVVYGSSGNNMRLELPLKGIDKVLAEIKN